MEQALFYLFGQDYKSTRTEGPRNSGRGRTYPQNRWGNYRTYGAAYVTEEDESFQDPQEYEYVDDTADPVYYKEENELYEEETMSPMSSSTMTPRTSAKTRKMNPWRRPTQPTLTPGDTWRK